MKRQEEAQILLDQMLDLRREILAEGKSICKSWEDAIDDSSRLNSILNLSYYLAIRRRHIGDLQKDLSHFGLSSLGRLESRVINTIDAVVVTLAKIAGVDLVEDIDYPPVDHITAGRRQLEENTTHILGPRPDNRNTRIMVTMSSDYCLDYKMIKNLIKNGMNVARINCAHDSKEEWTTMIDHIRRAEEELQKSCKILMDVAGPKARSSWLMTSTNESRIQVGDYFLLTGANNTQVEENVNFKLGCSIPQMLDFVEIGHTIKLDDGAVEGRVEDIRDDGILVKVERVSKQKGVKLKVEKGINFPDSAIDMGVITDKDRTYLDFVCENADIIGVSFVKTPQDLREFRQEIKGKIPKDKDQPAIMAKIETVQGTSNLGQIIIEGISQGPFAIMIARGDLAVEAGFLRLAELQQEIISLCEAADVPVVWATQVLEDLNKTGIPTRAEVTDAWEGSAKADCVMLNKGDYILETVEFLDKMIETTATNLYKKTPILRDLGIAKNINI